MALLSGLPVPQMTSPTDRGRSGGRGMSNFIQLMSLIQGGKADAATAAAKTAENENFAKGATLAHDWWKGVQDPKNLSSEEIRSGAVLSAHPYAGKFMKMGADFQGKIAENERALQAAKVKVTETHAVNKFNDDLPILATEDPEAFFALSAQRQDPNSLPTPEMVQMVAKAKQSHLQKQAVEKQALEDKTRRQPASIQLTDEILSSEQKANEAEAQGDTKTATQLRDRATLLREQTKGQEVVTGYDDQGRPIIRMGKGVGAATVGTQSQAQQKLLRYENTVELLNHLSSVLKPEHVGAAGVAGEFILDRGLSQLVPELANKDRVDARATLIAAREGLMREVSNDSRFSNIDREEISKALPSTGVFESLPSAQQKMETVRNLITNRGKVYAKGLGEKAPLWTLTADEIKAQYKEFQDSGGKKGIDKETAVRALVRFH